MTTTAAEPLHHYIEKLYRYHLWRVERLTGLLQTLPPSVWDAPVTGSFASLRAVVVHTHWAERLWLSRFWGGAAPPKPDELQTQLADHQALCAAWRRSSGDILAYLSALTEETVVQPLLYHDQGGNPHEMRKIDLLYHVVDHCTYHCGQIITILRTLSVEPVPTSFVVYLRDLKAKGK